jgi:V/A-type H+-transporting ATPase subunit I
MIAPMKKYSFLIYHKDYMEFLDGIRDIGVLHVIERQSGEIEDDELRAKYQQVNEFNQAIKFLSKRNPEAKPIDEKETDGISVLNEYKKLQSDQESYQQKLAQLQKEKVVLEPWGDFSWNTIEKLQQAGYIIEFYICPNRNFDPKWEADFNLMHISEVSSQKYFVVLHTPDETIDIHAEKIKLPEISLKRLNKSINEIIGILEKTEELYDDFAARYLDLLEQTRGKLAGELDFKKVVLNTEKQADEKLMLLEGWVPVEKEPEINKFLNESDVYYQAEKPTPKDNIPVLLKNKKFPKLFEAIGELYSLPAYREIDLTPFFAPFFMLFFGFCLGDAGYGLLFILAATYFKFKADKKFKPILTLIQFLGLATVLFGTITGTIFGMNLIDTGYLITDQSVAIFQQHNLPADIIEKLNGLLDVHIESKLAFQSKLKDLLGSEAYANYHNVIIKNTKADFPFLNSFRHLLLDPDKMFKLALILGGVQIIFGMFIKAANQARMYGYRYAFPTLGWLLLILGGGTVYLLNSTAHLTDNTAKIIFFLVLGISSLGIYFFNNPKRNILINFGAGLWDTYNMVTGILGDLLSYIRLFALGISSAILGFVFNDLAMNMSPFNIPVVGQLVFVLILLIGHGINIFMSGLGSFVHPLRLTFVEFYKNAGYIGGGKKYNPFGKK